MLDLDLNGVVDRYVRQNLQRLLEHFRKDPYLKGDFSLVEGEVDANGTGIKFKHNLKFTPKDAILTSAQWSGAIGVLTFQTGDFDDDEIYVTVSGLGASDTVTFRALIGRIEE
jgi:hypothetical protein